MNYSAYQLFFIAVFCWFVGGFTLLMVSVMRGLFAMKKKGTRHDS